MLLRTARATFSLQGNMPFPLAAVNNTKNGAAIPDCKQKAPAKHGEVTDLKFSEVPKGCSGRETHTERGDTLKN